MGSGMTWGRVRAFGAAGSDCAGGVGRAYRWGLSGVFFCGVRGGAGV
jgi:hypothetical protein